LVNRNELPREFSFEAGEKTINVRKMVNEDKLSPFYKKTMKDVFMYSLTLAYSEDTQIQVERKTGGAVVPTRVFTDLDISLMKSIAIASTNDVNILLPENKTEFVNLIEEYVNGGFNLLYYQIYGRTGDPVDLLEEEIRNYYEQNYVSEGSIKSRIINPRDYLEEFENDLRQFIKQGLMDVSNNLWWKQRIPGSIKKEAKKRKETNEGIEVNQNDPDLIYYIDFSEYFEIIKQTNNWDEVFKSHFPTKNWVEAKLNIDIKRVRNNVAHNRPISLDDEKKLIRSINDLKECFSI